MKPSGSGDFAKNWPLIVTCMVGVSTQSVAVYSFGQFMAPVEAAFGWTRAQFSEGLTLGLVLGFILSPIVGRAVDVMSLRVLAILGLILSGLSMAALSLASRDLDLWLVLWGAHAIGTSLTAPTVWMAMVASRFKTNQSFAMALALCGGALTAGFAPPAARYLIDTFGWRPTFQILGLSWCGAALLLAVAFGVDRPFRTATAKAPKANDLALRLRSVFLSATFLKLFVVVFAVMTAQTAYTVHFAPSLVDSGFDRREAANIAGIIGVALIVGKLGVGWFFDRVSLNVVTTTVMLCLATGCCLLSAVDGRVPVALAAGAAIGISGGAMLTVMVCVTARYFRPEDFGVVFGVLASAMTLGAAAGPMIASLVHDRTGSYTMAFWAGIAVAAGSALILRTLAPVGVSPHSRIGDSGVHEIS